MNKERARQRLEIALATRRQRLEAFFLARLSDLSFEYEEELCRIRFPLEDLTPKPQGNRHYRRQRRDA